MSRKRSVTTVHLGQFTRETANAIAGRLEKAGIVWWYKEPGYLSQVWEFGVRLFVDRERLEEAQQIAERVTMARERTRKDREAAERVEATGGNRPERGPLENGDGPAHPPDERR